MRSIFETPLSSMQQVRALWQSCDRCVFASLWKATGPCLPSDSSEGRDALVVGQWPGEQDMKNGVPFSGKQGLITQRMLHETGFPARSLFYTNVLLCSCPMVPTKAVLTNCRPQIDQTLDVVRPKIVIALGRHAATRFGFKGGIRQIHGKPGSYRGYTVIPCVHTAAIARAKGEDSKARVERDVRSDLRKALALYQETKKP